MLVTLMPATGIYAQSGSGRREIIQLRVYHFSDSIQEGKLDEYLRTALIPSLHRVGIGSIGAFKGIANDTAIDKKIYLLFSLGSMKEMQDLDRKLGSDKDFMKASTAFRSAPVKSPPYNRLETIFAEAFKLAPSIARPKLQSPRKDHVYELRSYESATEARFENKVEMFNEGGEVALFERLGFNAVFYSSVISGPRMPNLMYMTSFENMQERDAHWKLFVDSPEWKKLSAMEKYKDNVSHIDITFLRAAEYSDF